jgi:hypothetical protein
MFRILAITATLLGIASAAHADVYRWTDAKGIVQYSDRWVPGSTLVKTDKNHTPPPAASAVEAPSEPPADPAASERTKRELQADLAKSRAEQCKKATEAYEKAVSSRRIYKEGPNGEKNFVTDAEADAYRLQMLNARKQACGN